MVVADPRNVHSIKVSHANANDRPIAAVVEMCRMRTAQFMDCKSGICGNYKIGVSNNINVNLTLQPLCM